VYDILATTPAVVSFNDGQTIVLRLEGGRAIAWRVDDLRSVSAIQQDRELYEGRQELQSLLSQSNNKSRMEIGGPMRDECRLADFDILKDCREFVGRLHEVRRGIQSPAQAVHIHITQKRPQLQARRRE
jgi:hypothetical protein